MRALLLLLLLLAPRPTWAALTLAWDYPDDALVAIAGFRVERSTDNQASWQWRATVARVREWRDASVPAVPTCYRVRAMDAVTWSPPSNVVCITPPSRPTTLRGVVAP